MARQFGVPRRAPLVTDCGGASALRYGLAAWAALIALGALAAWWLS